MDHGGQREREGSVMSHGQEDAVDLCDNLPDPKALTAQNRNLNETQTLTQTESHSLSQNEEREGGDLIQKPSFNNNSDGPEEEGNRGRSREEDEEEENDEVMKDEEEEESEESSSLIRCQSPDTPMTDSSYSETGSLLETPYPFSPGTSPEPTSPIIPVASPETAYPISPVEQGQAQAEVDSLYSNTGSVSSTAGSATCTPGPIDCVTLTVTSATRPASTAVPMFVTESTGASAKTTDSASEPLTSSAEPILAQGPTCAKGPLSLYAEPFTSTRESPSTCTVTACTTRLTASIAGPVSSTAETITLTTGTVTSGTEPLSTTGPTTSNPHPVTSTAVPTSVLVPTCITRPFSSPTLLASLEQLAQRGDDTHLPQYLHQIAEAFVLQQDYQRALWCIQLERLYHQRILDNLNILQEHWENLCGRTSDSHLATQELNTLTHICQTHSRPRARDAVCATLDFLRPSISEEETLGAPLSSCTSGRQAEGGMEQSAADSSLSWNSDPVTSSTVLTDGIRRMDGRTDTDRESEGRAGFHGGHLSDRKGSEQEGGEAEGGIEHIPSAGEIGLHPPAAGEVGRSKPADVQGVELEPTQEEEVIKEEEETEREAEDAAKALEMEKEGEEEEEKQEERDSPVCLKAHTEETLLRDAEVEVQQLHQEDHLTETELQESEGTRLYQEAHLSDEQQEQGEEEEEEEEEYGVESADIIREAASLDDQAKLITVEEISPASGLVSILKKRSVCVDNVCASPSSEPQPSKPPAKRRVRFKVPDDSYEHDVGGGDSCLLLFLLCLVTVVISVGGTALYCTLGDAHSSVCQDFSRNADFYIMQMQRGIAQIQHWFAPGS
ncbi:consortin [Myripristis murdjan]|uniref:consortin n=1 Tax=Myripristis murdjan TaxID=586833 RepID=UPI0011761919|nr:consortin-like [Myripristis murdjan]